MINQDYDYVKRRWREWWKRENEDRPLVSVVAPKNGKIFPEKYENDVAGRWQDIEYVVEREKFYCENTYYGGESFPMFNPNLGPDIYGAILGDCDIEFAEQTSWSKHLEKPELEDCPPFAFDENNRWWKKIKAMTEYAVEKAGGGFLVGVTDLHTGLDAITSLYGPERVCTAMYDCPEKLKELLASSEKVAERIFSELFAVTRRRQEGTMNWSQIWDPDGNYYIASCDFACLISENAFSQCAALTSFRAEGKVSLGSGAFRSCNALEGIELNENFQSIAYDAVMYCDRFAGYTQEEGCKKFSVSDGVLFEEGKALLSLYWMQNYDMLVLPRGVPHVQLFCERSSAQSGFTSVLLNEDVQSISALGVPFVNYELAEESEFLKAEQGVLFSADGTKLLSCPKLHNAFECVVPDTVIEIADNAFWGIENISCVRLGAQTQKIGAHAFQNASLQQIVFCESLVSVGQYAFSSANIRTLQLPAGIFLFHRPAGF